MIYSVWEFFLAGKKQRTVTLQLIETLKRVVVTTRYLFYFSHVVSGIYFFVNARVLYPLRNYNFYLFFFE